MPIILSIDTAGDTATVVIGNEAGVIASRINTDQKNHASFLQPAIHDLLQLASFSINDIDAVSVVNGPGSYTGLRVGLASAKGIAYAAKKPMILLSTLRVMAWAAIKELNQKDFLYCPLIDARRNEVFTALYDFDLNELLPAQPLIIENNSYISFLDRQKLVFFGSGHNKCGKLINHENAVFTDMFYSVHHINDLAFEAYEQGQFSDIAYSEPYYTKEFFY